MSEHTSCAWAPSKDALYRAYHDTEWGVPEYDSRALWEKLQLDGMQAGLSWITILRKRETMREEFDGFDPEKIARWTQPRIDKALTNPGIIRSPKKIEACIGNARAFLDGMEQGEDFSEFCWSFVDGKPIDFDETVPHGRTDIAGNDFHDVLINVARRHADENRYVMRVTKVRQETNRCGQSLPNSSVLQRRIDL